jgi:hypothetical protein
MCQCNMDVLGVGGIEVPLQPLLGALSINRASWRKDVRCVEHREAVSSGETASVGVPDH